MENKLPRIMAISLSTWREDSGIHTQTDLFKFWDSDKVAQIYTRANFPNTKVCNRFFQISENAVIKSVLSRKKVGRVVENGKNLTTVDSIAAKQEAQLYKMAHKKKSWLYTLLRELVWTFGCWKSEELDRFVNEFDPDVYFVPIYPVVYMGKIQRYLLKKHPRPYVCYLADDNYSYMSCGRNVFAYIHRFWLRKYVKKLAVECDEMFTITKTEADDTDNLFGTHSVVLTKGIDYSNLELKKQSIVEPIKMVYTGKLVIGRHFSIAAISKALEKINRDKERIVFDIYSGDTFDEKTMQLFNSNGCHFHGAVPMEKVYDIQNSADVVVFVESLEKEYRKIARLSFSTKLTDYFKSGKCIFAIGDEDIAPIQYLKKNDAAVICCEYEQIEQQLRSLVENKELISEYGKKAFDCGKRNHNIDDIKKTFIDTITRCCNKSI